jgi:hypothetical protein
VSGTFDLSILVELKGTAGDGFFANSLLANGNTPGPEPSTGVLLVTGLVLLTLQRRCRLAVG